MTFCLATCEMPSQRWFRESWVGFAYSPAAAVNHSTSTTSESNGKFMPVLSWAEETIVYQANQVIFLRGKGSPEYSWHLIPDGSKAIWLSSKNAMKTWNKININRKAYIGTMFFMDHGCANGLNVPETGWFFSKPSKSMTDTSHSGAGKSIN